MSTEGQIAVQNVHDTTKRDQFLMKLRFDFEDIQTNLMNRAAIFPFLDECLNGLLREEQRLLTQINMEQHKSASLLVAYAVQGKPRGRDMSTIQSFCCKGHGHFASHCPKMFCNYCEKGHIIKECQIIPPRRNATAFTATDDSSTTPVYKDQNPPAFVPTLTLEMVQQMFISAFSTFGLSGNASLPSSPWYFDSGASNHMTNNVVALTNVTNYSGNLQIHIANGNNLPISTIGDIFSSLTNVYVSPDLTSNLISVGQLVDNDCRVEFSKSGCLVKDQHLGKMIAKGPKVERLFPLYSSLSPCFFCLLFLVILQLLISNYGISVLVTQIPMYFMN